MEVAKDLGARLDSERRAYAKLIEGEIQLKHGKAQAAIDLFQAARQLADTWVGPSAAWPGLPGGGRLHGGVQRI